MCHANGESYEKVSLCFCCKVCLFHMTFQSLAAVTVAENKGNRTYSFLDLMRSPKLRKLAILSGTTWLGMLQHNNILCFKTASKHYLLALLIDSDFKVYCFCRFGVAFTYYGISLNISGFGLNLYLTQFIYGAIEMPSKLLAYLCLDKVGRRYSQVGTLVTTGVCIGITILIPKGKEM